MTPGPHLTSASASGSFRRQIVVLTSAVTAFAMLLLTVVLQLVLADQTKRDVDRVLEDRADAVISSAQADSTTGLLAFPDATLDAGVAVYDDSGALVAGSAPNSLRDQYGELRSSTTTRLTSVGEGNRILTQPFVTDSGVHGVVVVTERLAPYEEAEHYALLVSLLTGLIATATAAFIAAWITRRALQPVADMAATAADWSEHDLGRRFDLGPPTNELSALAGTLDILLDRVAAVIRSEQRLTSELAHELRTPLTTIQGTADLALMRDGLSGEARTDLTEIAEASRRMSTTITTLLELARNEASLVEASVCSLGEILGEVVDSQSENRVAITVVVGEVRLALPHALAVRALAPLVANAVRFAATTVAVSARPGASGFVEVVVEDDGPGIDVRLSKSLFEPGATSGSGAGSGLGLAIARRVARSVGGDVSLEAAGPPTRFVVRLPTG